MTTRFPSPPPNYNHSNASHANLSSFEPHANSNTSASTIHLHDPNSQPNPRALTPYLTLPHLLSLTWLASPVISLLFVAFRLVNTTESAQDAVKDAKSSLMASCLAAQEAASAAASIPRYMAIATNEGIVNVVNASIDASRETMILCLTIVEAIIEFIIDMYRSTFLCFLELVIRGGLAILIGAVQQISDFVTNSLSTIRTSIQNDVATANNVIAAAVAAINKVANLVNVNLNVPQFNIPSLNALNNFTIPTGFEDSLIKLNNSLPTLDGLRERLDSIIEKPFDIVKADINDTFASIRFDGSVLGLPQQRALSFCGSMDTGVVDDLGHDLSRIARIVAALLVVAVICVIGANCFLQWWRWRSTQKHLEYIRDAWRADPTVVHQHNTVHNVRDNNDGVPAFNMTNHNLMILINTSEHPLISKLLDRMTTVFRLTPSQHINLRFFASYVFHPPALACLLIGLFGLIAVQIQLAAVGPLQAHYTSRLNSSISDFSTSIATQLNSGMTNSSTEYANNVNSQIFVVQKTINDNLFGWVNTTTVALNDTVVGFYQEIQDAINATLGGTILEGPAQEFLRCMLGTKIQSIEDALTFLHNNLQVNITPVPTDVLILSNGTMDEMTRPIALAAIGGGAPGNTTSTPDNDGSTHGLVGKVITRYIAALKKERIMFAVFLLLWLLVALIALFIIAWHSYGVEWVEERKREKFRREKGKEITPWYNRNHTSDGERGAEAGSPEAIRSMANEAPSDRRTIGLFPSDIPDTNERRRFRGDEEVKTPMSEVDLRTFTPLASPRSRRSRLVIANPTNNDSLAIPVVKKEAEGIYTSQWDWDEEDSEKKRGRWSIWKTFGTKLRNDTRRADRMMDPLGYRLRESEPAARPEQDASGTSGGWLSRLAFWRSQPVDDNESLTDNSYERHNALNASNFIPPTPVQASAPASVPNVVRPSPVPIHSQNPSFTLAAPPPPRRAQQDVPGSVGSTRDLPGVYAVANNTEHEDENRVSVNPAVPIHYHFVSQRQNSVSPPQSAEPELERKTSIMDRPRPPRESNPFADSKRGPNARISSTFPPPGLLASRERTILPNRGYVGVGTGPNRYGGNGNGNSVSPVGAGATGGNPFATPFDDPRSPATPASGPYPRAI